MFTKIFTLSLFISVSLACDVYEKNNSSSQLKDSSYSALSNTSSLKIMTFNVLGGDLCRNMTDDLKRLAQYIKQNNIAVTALQELISLEDQCLDYNMVEILKKEFNNTNYKVSSRKYLHYYGHGKKRWYRAFIYSVPAVGSIIESSISAENNQGAEAIVLETSVGKIRFVNIHPQPGQQALNLDKTLIPFLDGFRRDGIPMVVMGDYNLSYQRADSQKILARFEAAGFYRACSPRKFPTGGCDDTVTSPGDLAIDHVFIDNRAGFEVTGAFVERTFRFSDHLPVVVHLTKTVEKETNAAVETKGIKSGAGQRTQQIFADGKYWTLNIDANYAASNPGGLQGTSLAANSVYMKGPCRDQGNLCRIDALGVGTMKQGNRDVLVQQIIARGRYWTLDIGNQYTPINPGGFDGFPLASNSFYAQGPCKDHLKDCRIDDIGIGTLRQGQREVRVQQIFAYGKYWTLDIDADYQAINPGGLAGTPLSSNAFFANGPCKNRLQDCRIDGIAIGTLLQGGKNVRVQQILAYGKYWTLDIDNNYTTLNPGGMDGMELKANSVYAQGPCLTKGGVCNIDALAIGSADGK